VECLKKSLIRRERVSLLRELLIDERGIVDGVGMKDRPLSRRLTKTGCVYLLVRLIVKGVEKRLIVDGVVVVGVVEVVVVVVVGLVVIIVVGLIELELLEGLIN